LRREPESVGDELWELPAAWTWTRVGLFAEVQGGIQKTPSRKPVKSAYPYLRVANVLRGSLDLSEIHRFELASGELERWRLLPGDVLVVEGNGSITEIGRCALWRGEIPDCVHQNHIIRVRCHPNVDPAYLHWFLNAPQGRDIVTGVASSTSGLYTLSVSKVRRIAVPIAPLPEQRRIVSCIESLLSQASAIEAAARLADACLKRLDQAVLSRAFRGELVEQDPNDEPAGVLLERIRARREASHLRAGRAALTWGADSG